MLQVEERILRIPQFEAKEKYLKLRNKKNTLRTHELLSSMYRHISSHSMEEIPGKQAIYFYIFRIRPTFLERFQAFASQN